MQPLYSVDHDIRNKLGNSNTQFQWYNYHNILPSSTLNHHFQYLTTSLLNETKRKPNGWLWEVQQSQNLIMWTNILTLYNVNGAYTIHGHLHNWCNRHTGPGITTYDELHRAILLIASTFKSIYRRRANLPEAQLESITANTITTVLTINFVTRSITRWVNLWIHNNSGAYLGYREASCTLVSFIHVGQS